MTPEQQKMTTHHQPTLATDARVCYGCRPLPLSKGVRLCATHALNPAAYEACVTALKIAIPALQMAESEGYQPGNAVSILQRALANAEGRE